MQQVWFPSNCMRGCEAKSVTVPEGCYATGHRCKDGNHRQLYDGHGWQLSLDWMFGGRCQRAGSYVLTRQTSPQQPSHRGADTVASYRPLSDCIIPLIASSLSDCITTL
jgi:hypothetical protein